MKKKFIQINSLLKSILAIGRKCHTICHQFWLANDKEMEILLVMTVKLYPYLYKYVVIISVPSCCFYKKLGLEEQREKENVLIFY